MKKMYVFIVSILFLSTLAVTSCKKKDDPAPDGSPKLNSGVVTELQVYRGYTEDWDLSDKVTDPQGDSWNIKEVTSSDTEVLSVAINRVKGSSVQQSISYSGTNRNGTATITIVVEDSTGATSTITATVTVSTYPSMPPIVLPAGAM